MLLLLVAEHPAAHFLAGRVVPDDPGHRIVVVVLDPGRARHGISAILEYLEVVGVLLLPDTGRNPRRLGAIGIDPDGIILLVARVDGQHAAIRQSLEIAGIKVLTGIEIAVPDHLAIQRVFPKPDRRLLGKILVPVGVPHAPQHENMPARPHDPDRRHGKLGLEFMPPNRRALGIEPHQESGTDLLALAGLADQRGAAILQRGQAGIGPALRAGLDLVVRYSVAVHVENARPHERRLVSVVGLHLGQYEVAAPQQGKIGKAGELVVGWLRHLPETLAIRIIPGDPCQIPVFGLVGRNPGKDEPARRQLHRLPYRGPAAVVLAKLEPQGAGRGELGRRRHHRLRLGRLGNRHRGLTFQPLDPQRGQRDEHRLRERRDKGLQLLGRRAVLHVVPEHQLQVVRRLCGGSRPCLVTRR